MVKIGSIVTNVSDVPRAARFWAEALNYVPRDGGIAEDWAILRPADGNGPNLSFDREDRTHLDLYAADAEEQASEVARLIGLGATRIEDWPYPEGADFIVLADPVGNLFCVIDTAKE